MSHFARSLARALWPPKNFSQSDPISYANRASLACVVQFDESPIFLAMLRNFLIALSIAILAAGFRFGGIAGFYHDMSRTLFYFFLMLFVVALIVGRRAPPAR